MKENDSDIRRRRTVGGREDDSERRGLAGLDVAAARVLDRRLDTCGHDHRLGAEALLPAGSVTVQVTRSFRSGAPSGRRP